MIPFAKLETFPSIGQVLAVIEEDERGAPCVLLRVSTPDPGLIVRSAYTFEKAPDPNTAAAAFFDALTREDLEAMGQALHDQARAMMEKGQ